MPYKNAEDRRKQQKKLRENPEWLSKHRAYMRNYTNKWYEKNRERLLKYRKEWSRNYRKTHPYVPKGRKLKSSEEKMETLRAKRHRYYWRNRERINASAKEKRILEPERFQNVDRKRYQRDREKRIHASRVQRAKRGGAECYLSIEDWLSLLRSHNFKCSYCEVQLTKSNRSLDHKTPLVRGGTNDIENLAPCCRRCNTRKNRLTELEFRMLLTRQ